MAAGGVPVGLERWRVDARDPLGFVNQVDAVDFAIAAVCA